MKLRLGDIIRVKWRNGVTWTGTVTNVRGFWDDREEFRHWYWIKTDTVQHSDEREPSKRVEYTHVDVKHDEITKLGHDDNFRMPSKRIMLMSLIELFKHVPYNRRNEVYRKWQVRYPHLSHSAYSELTNNCWHRASVAVTTLDELLAAEKSWMCKARLNAQATKHIKEVIFNMPREQWFDELFKMRWITDRYKLGDQMHYWVSSFKPMKHNMWRSVFANLVPQARTPNELVSLMKMWGAPVGDLHYEKPPDLEIVEPEKPKKKWKVTKRGRR